METLVASDHYYSRLDVVIDWTFLYKETEGVYGTEGQESIDPVVFFKMLLIDYINIIPSDRALINFCNESLAARWFLRYDIDESLPWHSAISRTRQLYGEEMFLKLFENILRLCVKKGMVRGRRQAVSRAYIKANASMDSLKEKDVMDDVEKDVLKDGVDHVNELNAGSAYKVQASMKKAVERHHA